jgi:hypothetical protein
MSMMLKLSDTCCDWAVKIWQSPHKTTAVSNSYFLCIRVVNFARVCCSKYFHLRSLHRLCSNMIICPECTLTILCNKDLVIEKWSVFHTGPESWTKQFNNMSQVFRVHDKACTNCKTFSPLFFWIVIAFFHRVWINSVCKLQGLAFNKIYGIYPNIVVGLREVAKLI